MLALDIMTIIERLRPNVDGSFEYIEAVLYTLEN